MQCLYNIYPLFTNIQMTLYLKGSNLSALSSNTYNEEVQQCPLNSNAPEGAVSSLSSTPLQN